MKKYALLLVLFLPACAVTNSGKIRDCTEDYIERGALSYDSLREVHSVCHDIYRPGHLGPRARESKEDVARAKK